MRVDVVILRPDGAKLPQAEVLAAAPLRAELTVETTPGGLVIARLSFPWHGTVAPGTALPTLQNVRLRRLLGDGLVLVGLEWVGVHHERRQCCQAWWCRRATESGPSDPAGGRLAAEEMHAELA